ncbi:recombination protein NinB [Cupriavidus pinatubonensis]|uniref:recombination protein NinB n=1 Tax=Cupriavidus pinatubonensis TaxID=248026 RepID=UPI001C737C23|nr:recombination protein NinB [Cupriavidus pinatubonensis]QYY30255.1 recombination protein NinB [Cupriavidus pinatubonensis]
MAALYKEFTLKSPGIWPFIVSFIKANAAACADKGAPLRIIVTAEERRRTNESNRYYWGVVLRDVSEQAWVQGRQFDKDTWHTFFADLYGVKIERTLPDGRIHLTRKSTSDMTAGEFSEFLTKVQAHAANEFGVTFDGVHT